MWPTVEKFFYEVAHIKWTRRRLGYVVWGVAFLVIIVPELLAAWHVTERWLPFPTVSRTIGHLEVVNPLWEIFPTALIVLFVYALLRAPLPAPIAGARTPAPTVVNDDDAVPNQVHRFFVKAVVAVVAVGILTWLASRRWPDQHLYRHDDKQPNFYVAYVLWGGSFVLWVVLPTAAAIRRKHRFPSLPKTIVYLERWLGRDRRPTWRDRIGKGAAWLVGFALVWGMAFLLLHLTLYPFPDITRELNKSEIVCTDVPGKQGTPVVVSRLPHDRDPNCQPGNYPNLGG